MKIIARTFAILMVAALIVGGLLALGATTSLASEGDRPDFAAEQAQASNTTSGTTDASSTDSTSAAMPPYREGGEGASLFGAVEILKNLAIVGVITAIVAGGKRLLGRRPPAPRPQAAA